jgi:hypothetical protein
MNFGGLNTAQSIIGILVVLCSFTIITIYVIKGSAPDGYVIAIVSGALSGVTGFFFGHANGTTSALAVAATALANRTNPGEVVNPPDK